MQRPYVAISPAETAETAIHRGPHLRLYFPSFSVEDFITSLHPLLVFFIFKHFYFLLCSPPLLLIGEPVPIPVTAALAIRSAVGLFKAWGTRGLDLLRHLCTSNAAINHRKATWTKKRKPIKHQNTLILRATRHTFCCTFEEVEWGFCIKYAWAHVAG